MVLPVSGRCLYVCVCVCVCIYIYIYIFFFFLRWVFVAVHRLPLASVSRGSSPVAALRLFMAVASLAVDHAGF